MGSSDKTHLLVMKGMLSEESEEDQKKINRYVEEIMEKAREDKVFLFAMSMASLKLVIEMEEKEDGKANVGK
jgi:hypothetical protein